MFYFIYILDLQDKHSAITVAWGKAEIEEENKTKRL